MIFHSQLIKQTNIMKTYLALMLILSVFCRGSLQNRRPPKHMEISKSPQSAQKVTLEIAICLVVFIFEVFPNSNAEKYQKTNFLNLRSFFNEIRIFKNLRNMIHYPTRLVVTKMKSDKKENVADVVNIIHNDIKPNEKFGKLKDCKNMEKLSMKVRRITRRS